ncbi:MAG: HAMP domain-containing protein [Myxococcota bacterium]|nr:HAMP domain-containing protein [Myxococcota bacterium]
MFSRLRLGTQLWVIVSLLLAAASTGIAWYLTQVQTRSLASATQRRLSMKEDSLTAKAALLARNAALASAAAAVTLDFDFLQGVMSKTVAGDDTVEYAFIADAKDKVVVHSDPKRLGSTMPGAGKAPKDLKDGVSVQIVNGKTLEAVAPIMLGDDVWGTVRYGVSFLPVLREAELATQALAEAKRKNLVFSVLLALSLAVLCVLVSILAASRLLRPLRALESTIQQVLARGTSLRVEVPRLRELAHVATGFNVLLARLETWEKRLRGKRLQSDLQAWAAEHELTEEHKSKLNNEWQAYLATPDTSQSAAPPKSGGSLRLRLIGLMLGLTSASVLIVSGLLYQRMRNDLTQALEAMSQQVRLDLADKGFSITRNAALAVSQAASVREYLFLMQVVRSTITADTEIVTGFIKDPKGRVLVHSDPKKTGAVEETSEHVDAMRLGRPESRLVDAGAARILEVTAPIQVGNAAWGTLSFGLSDEHQKEILAGLQTAQRRQVEEALAATAVGVAVLLIVAALAAWLAARRIVGPLDRLTRDLDKICAGARTLRVEVYSCRELATFSMSINELTAMTLEREKELEQNVSTARNRTA